MIAVVLLDRTTLGKAVLLRHGDAVVPDYEKIVALAAPGGQCLRHLWAADLPPSLVALFEDAGWVIHNHPRGSPGLVEADMAVTLMRLPGSVTRFVFVIGSRAIVPVVQMLAEDGEDVIVCGFEHDIALEPRECGRYSWMGGMSPARRPSGDDTATTATPPAALPRRLHGRAGDLAGDRCD